MKRFIFQGNFHHENLILTIYFFAIWVNIPNSPGAVYFFVIAERDDFLYSNKFISIIIFDFILSYLQTAYKLRRWTPELWDKGWCYDHKRSFLYKMRMKRTNLYEIWRLPSLAISKIKQWTPNLNYTLSSENFPANKNCETTLKHDKCPFPTGFRKSGTNW